MKKHFTHICIMLLTLSILNYGYIYAEACTIPKILQQAKPKNKIPPTPLPKDFLIIDSFRPTNGMFSICLLVLGHLYLYEKGNYPNVAGLAVFLGSKGIYHDPAKGPNWWDYYFEPIYLGSSYNAITKLTDENLNVIAWDLRTKIARNEAFQIIKKHIKPRAFITEKINQFVADNFKNFFMIGVHYRGTDKAGPVHEAPRVPYDEAIRAIAEQVDVLPKDIYKIFVATDEQAFLDYIQQVFPGKVIFTNAYRSLGSASVHHSGNNPCELGEQAIIDAILLSKCNVLIRTSSNLSLWSTFLNPYLPVVMLSYRPGNAVE